MDKPQVFIDEGNHYPVLLRKKKKTYEWVWICNIDLKEKKPLPLNPSGMATALAIRNDEPMPPITLEELPNGRYVLQDGRHRLLAFRLNGYKTIPAYVHKDKRKWNL